MRRSPWRARAQDGAGTAARASRSERLQAMAASRAWRAAAFAGLLLVSAGMTLRGLGSAYWIDEGLSVGIGSHPFLDIPGLLRQDGSPPLYYMLLHVWMSLFGTGEWATQALSAIIGLLAIPAAFWAGGVLGGRRVAWVAALLAAVNPFLTIHAYEARMYALLTLLGILAAGVFGKAFVEQRKAWRPLFGALLAAMLYTHNWALFFAGASVLALAWLAWRADLVERRALVRDGLVAFGMTALLYAPWLPTLLFQAQHTGAPWSQRPMFDELIFGTGVTIGGRGESVALVLAAIMAMPAFAAARRLRELRVSQTLLILFAGTILLAFVASQLSPAWAQRYLSIALGPLILFAAMMLPNAGKLGWWALAVFVALSLSPQPVSKADKTDEGPVAAKVEPLMQPGDLVVVTHPERVPIMRHYLGPEYRYADLFGRVADPRIMDWRDALERIKKVRVRESLPPLADSVERGGHLVLVQPIVDNQANSWEAPWTSRVARQSRAWLAAMNADPRFRVVGGAPKSWRDYRYGVRAIVYERVG